ncbi:MAG: aspartate racemase [Blastocatellia bacterium]|jgi:aspartate racemase|nr:aspartate racemase [Blastocatellia bacterium]
MTNVSTIGVLGGMGPEATNRLCALITALTPVAKDQDHIPVITYNNSLIPDRVGAADGLSESPVPEIVRTARVLERAGADLLVMPCNLAHLFIEEAQREIRIPILNMIEETVRHVIATQPTLSRVGLLASAPTIRHRLYESSFARHQRVVLTPETAAQQALVMEAIYGERGIKRGHKDEPRALLMEAAQQLFSEGAELIIAGCTEVSLVLSEGQVAFPVVDPLEVVARVAIERARAGSDGKRETSGGSRAVAS